MNMISTGAFLPEMDASNKQETVAEKFARVWEKKNSKVARAGGVSLMALSLAACGSSSDTTTPAVTPTPTPTPDPEPTTPVGQAFALEAGEDDTIIGTAGADTITAGTADLDANDIIVDNFSGDGDTLNLTMTAALAAADVAAITGIENVNLIWDAFGTLTADAAKLSGSTITLSSTKSGYIGNSTVNNAGDNTIVATAGIDRTVDVNGGESVTVIAVEGAVTVDGTGTAADDLSATVTGGTTINIGAANAFISATATANANTTDITVDTQAADADDVVTSITVTGGDATTDITTTDGRTTIVDAGAATTVSVAATAADTTASSATITALSGTSVTVDGTAATTDTADITLGAAEVDLDIGNTTALEAVSVTTAADSEITLVAGAQLSEMTVTSSGAVTLVAADAVDLGGVEVTNATGGLTVDLTSGAADLTDVAADLFVISTSGAHQMDFASGANISVAADVALNAGQTLTVLDGTRSTTDEDVMNIAIAGDQADIETVDVETTNITATFDAAADEDNTDDDSLTLTLVTVDGDLNVTSDVDTIAAEVVAGTDDVKFTVAGDLTATGTGITAGSIDLSGVTGDAAVTDVGDANITYVAAQGDNTVGFANVDTDIEYTGSAGADALTLAIEGGNGVIALGDGDNSVGAAAFDDGVIVISGGSGDDDITLSAVTTGVITLALGDGENTVSLGGVPAGYEAEITMGAGDDAITLTSAAAADTLTVDMGDGENTINIADDITDGTYDLDNVDIIDVNGDVGTAVVGATELTGQSYLLKASGSITAGAFDEQLAVEIDATGTFDFSNLSLASTLADGIGGIAVTYTAAVDGNVTLTSGDDAYTGTASDDVVIGGAGDDVIDGDDGDDTITGGTGADAMTAGAGADIFVIAAGDSGTTDGTQDVIDEFLTAGVDQLKLGVAGTADNYTEVDLTSGGASTYADALAQANTSMGADTDLVYVLVEDSTSTGGWDGTADGLLFVDTDGDNAADMMIELTGVLGADLAATDIIA